MATSFSPEPTAGSEGSDHPEMLEQSLGQPAVRWSDAWARAATGPEGFWRVHSPTQAFRTSLSDAPRPFAEAVLDRVGPTRDLVDIGAGDGLLLAALRDRPEDAPERLTGVDVRPAVRLDGVEWEQVSALQWSRPPGDPAEVIVLAELLDEIPVDVAIRDGRGWRYVLVDREGRESAGDPVDAEDAQWLARWAKDADRVEIGRSRDELVARLCRQAARILIVDYVASLPGPTLLGYREGQAMAPVPDGTMNLTSHVFLPSVVEAARSEGMRAHSRTQRDVLRDIPKPTADPAGSALSAAEVKELALRQRLEDPAGPGGFAWVLLQR